MAIAKTLKRRVATMRSRIKHIFTSRWAFPVIIVCAAMAFAIASSWNDSLIVDEVPHIGAGYSYIVKHDMHLNPEHPPLAKDLAGIALATFLNLKQTAFTNLQWTGAVNGQWEFGRALIYTTGNDADAITRVARLPMLLFFAASAFILFAWSRRLFGTTGAALALLLFSFSPTVLAHMRFVTTDVPALAGVLAATFFFIAYLRRPGWRTFIIASVVTGLALLTKFSVVLLVPYFGLLAMLWGWLHARSIKRRVQDTLMWGIRSVAVFAAATIIIVWPTYVYHTWSYPVERQQSNTTSLLAPFPNRTIVDSVVWASDKPVLRAMSWYATGLLMALQRAEGDNTITWLGRVVPTGGLWYFPLVYLLKEPLSWWALAFIALMIALMRGSAVPKRSWERVVAWSKGNFDIVAMGIWLVLYWAVSIRSPLNIGIRHILPAFPFAIMLVAGQIAFFIEHLKKHEARELRIFSLTIVLLLAWGVFEQVRVFPSYLSYFNQLAGGPSGGRMFVTDSNLDWGQELKRLGDFVNKNDIPKLQLDYFGWADPTYYMDGHFVPVHDSTYVDSRDFLRRNPAGGWIAVSATYFQHSISRDNAMGYRWLNAYTPVASIGNSMLVWHITPRP